jgi:hypothetical protein
MARVRPLSEAFPEAGASITWLGRWHISGDNIHVKKFLHSFRMIVLATIIIHFLGKPISAHETLRITVATVKSGDN